MHASLSPASGTGPRRAVFHIGMPKTGSSTIQSWLYGNVAALARQGFHLERLPVLRARAQEHVEIAICQFAEAGELFPNARLRHLFGIETRADQADFAARYSERFARAMARARGQTVLLSAEDIGGLTRTEAQARALDTWLGRCFDEVRYILYLRRQEDQLVSAYSQMVKTGRTERLDAFIGANKSRDYNAMVGAWHGAVGEARLSVRLLEPDALTGGDLIADFANAAGIDRAGLRPATHKNSALTRAAAEFLRALNAELRANGSKDPVNEPVYGNLVPFLQTAFADDAPIRLDARQTDEIRTANAASNEALRQRCFPERAALFPARPGAIAEVPPLDPADVARVGAIVLQAKQEGRLRAREDLRKPPSLAQRVWRWTKERHPALAARIGPIIGKEVQP